MADFCLCMSEKKVFDQGDDLFQDGSMFCQSESLEVNFHDSPLKKLQGREVGRGSWFKYSCKLATFPFERQHETHKAKIIKPKLQNREEIREKMGWAVAAARRGGRLSPY